jgi:glycosyltransferase involved in cell wall biosynthesis
MKRTQKIIFTVTSDLLTDQRMQRICSSMHAHGYQVLLVGRKLRDAKELRTDYQSKRISCLFNSGFRFYAEYNLRLFFYLLMTKSDAICAIDLDTILPCLWVSKLKKKKLIYDAHEYYTESPEIDKRARVKNFWERIAKYCIPKIDLGYTVNHSISEFLKERYKTKFEVVRNLPVKSNLTSTEGKYLLYQGVLNEGRGLEELILAMHKVEDCTLKIAGSGDIESRLINLIDSENLNNKVELLGSILPDQLREVTSSALLGFNLLDGNNKNYYYSLANKFFDYMMAGIPSISMNFPEYKLLNDQYDFSLLIEDIKPDTIAKAINYFLSNSSLQEQLRSSAIKAREELNWEKEEQKLLSLYDDLFSNSF